MQCAVGHCSTERVRVLPAIGWTGRALASRRMGVVALGISGSEAFPTEPFRQHFDVAHGEGLHCVAHAGEQAGPEAIRSALEVCRPERIGHGISVIDDPVLTSMLAQKGIPLEICPSSNVALGVAPSLPRHPFDQIYRSGIPVSVNSDDPPFFDTTLSEEYERLAATFGYDETVLVALAVGALEHAFLEPAERRALEDRFRAGLSALGVEYDEVAV